MTDVGAWSCTVRSVSVRTDDTCTFRYTCHRENQDIPEAPQARCSAADPLPAQPGGKLSTDHTFCRRGIRLVFLGNCATLNPSVLGVHTVRAVLQFDFVFFHSFSIGFPSAIANCANVRISLFLLDPRAKTVLNKSRWVCFFFLKIFFFP